MLYNAVGQGERKSLAAWRFEQLAAYVVFLLYWFLLKEIKCWLVFCRSATKCDYLLLGWLHWIQTLRNQCHISSGGGKVQDLSIVTDPSNSQGIWGFFFSSDKNNAVHKPLWVILSAVRSTINSWFLWGRCIYRLGIEYRFKNATFLLQRDRLTYIFNLYKINPAN